jgi:hypothetical protein
LKSNSAVSILATMMLLLLILYSLVVVLASVDSTVTSLAQAKKKKPTTTSSSSHHRTASTTTIPNTDTSNTVKVSPQNNDDEDNNQPSSAPSSLSLSPSSERRSDVVAPSLEEQQATVQRLFAASAIAVADGGDGNGVSGDDNGDSTNNFNSQIDQQGQEQEQQQSCLDSSYIDRFILPLKEARFTHIRPCVTVTGTVISGQKINADGDISFNMAVDPPYEGMLGPGNLDALHATSSREHGIHIEVICQEPIVSSQRMDVGACDGYNGPDFHSSLPTDHEHVMITGRFQIEWNEAPGGLTEIHPVYDIKTIPKS